MNIFQKKILLASQSPRRKDLLKAAGFSFRIVSPDIDEENIAGVEIRKVPEYLAVEKAKVCKQLARNDEIILACDTIVLLENKIYGKPKDKDDAVKMLGQLNGKMHEVISGVCLMNAEKQKRFSETTEVYFKNLTEEEIIFYVNEYKPFDKAGSYAIQEWIGLVGIEKIIGDYFNVMGLPVSRVIDELKNFDN